MYILYLFIFKYKVKDLALARDDEIFKLISVEYMKIIIHELQNLRNIIIKI